MRFFQDILSGRAENFRAPSMVQKLLKSTISWSSDHIGYPHGPNFGPQWSKTDQNWTEKQTQISSRRVGTKGYQNLTAHNVECRNERFRPIAFQNIQHFPNRSSINILLCRWKLMEKSGNSEGELIRWYASQHFKSSSSGELGGFDPQKDWYTTMPWHGGIVLECAPLPTKPPTPDPSGVYLFSRLSRCKRTYVQELGRCFDSKILPSG